MIRKYSESTKDSYKICSAKCGVASETCFILMFSTIDSPSIYKEKCLKLPVYTSFVKGSDCSTVDDTKLSGFDPIDPTEGIGLGNYFFKNVSKSGETYPKICMFHKP